MGDDQTRADVAHQIAECLTYHNYELRDLGDGLVSASRTDDNDGIPTTCPHGGVLPMSTFELISPSGIVATAEWIDFVYLNKLLALPNSDVHLEQLSFVEQLEEANCHISQSSGFLEYGVLEYLANFLQSSSDYGWQTKRNIYIHGLPEPGVGRVEGYFEYPSNRVTGGQYIAESRYPEEQGTHLLFSRNALDQPDASITHFTNTLLNHLLKSLASTGQTSVVSAFIEARSGAPVDAANDFEVPTPTQFSFSELASVAAQVGDVPKYTFDLAVLTRWKRAERGKRELSSYGEVAGRYNSDGTISIFDAAFDQNAGAIGEGTIIHEFGHAVWAGLSQDLRNNYTSISWKNGLAFGTLITPYAGKDVLEDFAEHFAAYMIMPKHLKKDFEKKYTFLRDHIFNGHEYFVFAQDQLTVGVPSGKPDLMPPQLSIPFAEAFTMTQRTEGELLIMSAKVCGLLDDISGIQAYSLIVKMQQPDLLSIGFDLMQLHTPVSWEPGCYSGESHKEVGKIIDGTWRITELALEDKAGNKKVVRGQSNAFVTLKDPKPQAGEKKPQMDFSKVRIEEIQVDGQGDEKYFKVHFPIEWKEGFSNAELTFVHEEANFTVKVKNQEVTKSEIGSAMQFGVGARPRAGTYTLRSIWMQSERGTRTTSGPIWIWNASQKTDNLQFKLKLPNSDTTTPEIDIDKIRLTHEFSDQLKEHIIKMSLKVTGAEGNTSFHPILQLPSGQQRPYFTRQTKVLRINDDGSKELEIIISLGQNPEDGEYILYSLSLEELEICSQRDKVRGLRESGCIFPTGPKVDIKLAERGISTQIKKSKTPSDIPNLR